MILINTSHISADFPFLLDGEENVEILDLENDPLCPVVPTGTIHYHLSAVMAGLDLLITGTVHLPVDAVCSRCGIDVHTELRVPKLCLLFEKVRDREVDLTNDIREELLLAIPTCFYCDPDCKGICPGCGANLNTEHCVCEKAGPPPADSSQHGGTSPWDKLDEWSNSEE